MSCDAGAAGSVQQPSAVAVARVTRCCSGFEPPLVAEPAVAERLVAAAPRRRRAAADPETLVAAARKGDARALARLVSLVENQSPELRRLLKGIVPMTGPPPIIGLTGG